MATHLGLGLMLGSVVFDGGAQSGLSGTITETSPVRVDAATVEILAEATVAETSPVRTDAATVEMDSFVARQLYVRTYLSGSGTDTTPAEFWGLDGTDNQQREQCWGAGGGGAAATTAGGGASYAEKTSTRSPSTGYPYAVGASGVDTDGGNSAYNTTDVVADGGQSGTNGGTAGTAANSTGTTKWSGAAASGTTPGGAAGSTEDASGATPGAPDGGYAQAGAIGKTPGAGGGVNTAGGSGRVMVSCLVQATAGFAYIYSRTYSRDPADDTARDITLPPADPDAPTGGAILVIASSDGSSPTMTMAGDWTALAQADQGSVSGRAWRQDATGTETVEITTTSEQINWVALRIYGPGGTVPGLIEWTTTTGNGSDPNSPDHDPTGGAADFLLISAIGQDGNAAGTITAIPSGYGNCLVNGAGTQNGCKIAIADRQANVTTENPGAWTAGAEQWWAATISVAAA